MFAMVLRMIASERAISDFLKKKKNHEQQHPVGAFVSTNLSVSTLQTAEDMFSDDNTTIEKSPEATALIESPQKITSAQTTTSFTTVVTPLVVRNKGGRPKGTTQASKMNLKTAIVAAKNEIVLKYLEMMKKRMATKLEAVV